jgi:hypothetical protein
MSKKPTNKQTGKQYVGIIEAAHILGTWPSYIHTLMRMSKLRGAKIDGKWKLDFNEVKAYAERLHEKRLSRSDVLGGDGDAA